MLFIANTVTFVKDGRAVDGAKFKLKPPLEVWVRILVRKFSLCDWLLKTDQRGLAKREEKLLLTCPSCIMIEKKRKKICIGLNQKKHQEIIS